MKFSTKTTLFVASWIFSTVSGQEQISPEEFYGGLVNGSYDAVLDIRTVEEWETGHIENATFVENLATLTEIPEELFGCEGPCRTIVVYCRSGNRAVGAIELLLANNFTGTIYNGLGVSQWTEAGYDLVDTDSVLPSCSQDSNEFVACDDDAVEVPSMTPTIMESQVPSRTPTIMESQVPSRTPTIMESQAPSIAPTTREPTAPPTVSTTLTSQEFYDGIMSNRFDAILDVRTQEEWDSGHIPNATFVENLGSLVDIPQELEGCQGVCYTLVVYCVSGNRANGAIQLLLDNGFQGTVYNGLGTRDWTDAGYDLVSTPSVEGVCDDNLYESTTTKSLEDCVKVLPSPSSSPTTTPSSSGMTLFRKSGPIVAVGLSVMYLVL